jgi:hypothetical protein
MIKKISAKTFLPYGLTIVLFIILYTVTYAIPNERLFWLYDSKSYWRDHYVLKLDLHGFIFTELLAGVIIFVNLYEVIWKRNERFFRRLIKSFISIILVFILNYFVYKIIDNGIPNEYEYRGGVPAISDFFVIVIYFTVELILLEIINFLYGKFISESRIIQLFQKRSSKKL